MRDVISLVGVVIFAVGFFVLLQAAKTRHGVTIVWRVALITAASASGISWVTESWLIALSCTLLLTCTLVLLRYTVIRDKLIEFYKKAWDGSKSQLRG